MSTPAYDVVRIGTGRTSTAGAGRRPRPRSRIAINADHVQDDVEHAVGAVGAGDRDRTGMVSLEG